MALTAADVLVRADMVGTTGLPEDHYTNDFAFHLTAGGAPTATELTNLFGAVDGFYNDNQTVGFSVGDMIGEAVNRAATHELLAYQCGSPMGSPIASIPWLGPNAPLAANDNLPTECAAVVSFHADLTGVLEESGSTRPRARRRGRLFIGPLTGDAFDNTQDAPLLEPGFGTCLRQAIIAMADEAATAGWTFSVWSRVSATLFPVVGGWTDNAPDTQRRRGTSSTARVTFTV